ncbi:MAG: hypothetical protein Tsb0014_28200 [Pleurocapsa sp.]
MKKNLNTKPIGKILQEACLVSKHQLEVALYDLDYYQDLRLGEILALRGWIKQDTVNFFVEQWNSLIKKQSIEYPLGYYLQQAALLNEAQIQSVLTEQKQIWMRFGAIAVLKGLIKQETIDFFLNNLFAEQSENSPFIGRKTINFNSRINTESSKNYLEKSNTEIDYEDIPWID